MPGVCQLKKDLKPSSTDQGDGVSALVIAISMITAFCRHLKYVKNIVMVTDGRGGFDMDGSEAIAGQLVREGINLTVL